MAVCGRRGCRHSRYEMKILQIRLGLRLMGSMLQRLSKLSRNIDGLRSQRVLLYTRVLLHVQRAGVHSS